MYDIRDSAITFQQISIFLTAAKYGNFTKAAEELHMSQSSVSRNILLIEETVGLILFVRVKKRVRLTPAGMYLAEALTQPLNQMENVWKKAFEIQACDYQTLKVCDVDTTDPEKYLLPIADRFEKDNPEVEVSISRETPVRVIDNLAAGKYDIAFLPSVYADSLQQAGLRFYKFMDLSPGFIISKRHSKYHQKDLNYKELTDDTVVAISGGKYSAYLDYVRKIMTLIGMQAKSIKIVDNPSSVLTQLARGDYVAIMDSHFTPIGQEHIRCVEIQDVPLFFGFVAAWSSENDNPYIQKFVRSTKDVFSKS